MLKIAQIQFEPKLGHEDLNIDQISVLLKQCAGCNLVVLPELANSGYNFIDRKQAFLLACEPNSSTYVEMLLQSCRKYNLTVVTGFHEKEGTDLFNSSLLISERGVIGKYRKIHLFQNEKDIFTKGNLGFPVFAVQDYLLGMLVCFDYLFSEAWRSLALKGADLVAHPSNLVTKFAYQVVPAQAIMNRYFIFTTNRIGTERELTFTGNSFAVDPTGEILNQAAGAEEILISEIDPLKSRDKMITSRNHVLKDRSANDYGDLLAY